VDLFAKRLNAAFSSAVQSVRDVLPDVEAPLKQDPVDTCLHELGLDKDQRNSLSKEERDMVRELFCVIPKAVTWTVGKKSGLRIFNVDAPADHVRNSQNLLQLASRFKDMALFSLAAQMFSAGARDAGADPLERRACLTYCAILVQDHEAQLSPSDTSKLAEHALVMSTYGAASDSWWAVFAKHTSPDKIKKAAASLAKRFVLKAISDTNRQYASGLLPGQAVADELAKMLELALELQHQEVVDVLLAASDEFRTVRELRGETLTQPPQGSVGQGASSVPPPSAPLQPLVLELSNEEISQAINQLATVVRDGDMDGFLNLVSDSAFPLNDKIMLHGLVESCQCGHVGMMNFFLTSYDVNYQTRDGQTALHIAYDKKYNKAIGVLLGQGANPDLLNRDGLALLHRASKDNRRAVVELLLQKGASPDVQALNGDRPLHFAYYKNNDTLAIDLLSNNADPNLLGNEGLSVVHHACKDEDPDFFSLLLKKNADVNLPTANGETPLGIICSNSNLEMFNLLMRYDPNSHADDGGHTLLHRACGSGALNDADQLLVGKANVNARTKNGITPIQMACDNGHIELAVKLLENGASLAADSEEALALVRFACMHGDSRLTEYLVVEQKVDVNRKGTDGATPFWLAIWNGHHELAFSLLDKGAKVDFGGADGAHLLFTACVDGNDNLLRFLASQHVDANAKIEGATLLWHACRMGHAGAVKRLLEFGAEPDIADAKKITPLQVAEQNHRHEVVRLLRTGSVEERL
jgi:ankyrin repeat protein